MVVWKQQPFMNLEKGTKYGELYCSNSSTVKALVGGICLVCTPLTLPWHLINGQLNNNVSRDAIITIRTHCVLAACYTEY